MPVGETGGDGGAGQRRRLAAQDRAPPAAGQRAVARAPLAGPSAGAGGAAAAPPPLGPDHDDLRPARQPGRCRPHAQRPGTAGHSASRSLGRRSTASG
ncbi:hypothetical protein L0F81_25675, partial [Streptomyces tricolor]|nr:hypothetical protein [Streptomyces tricolor]